MTTNMRLLTLSCVVLLGTVLGTQQCEAGGCEDINGDPIAGCFYVSRDIGIMGHELEQLSSAGAAGRIRPLKSNQNAAILDFDSVAIGNYLAANPGTVSAKLFVQPADGIPAAGDPGLGGDVGIQTVESTNDWAEGDGPFDGAARNWSSGTSSATYFYAATALDQFGFLSSGTSLEWIDPDSGPYTFTNRNADYATWGVPNTVGGGGSGANPTPQFTNSAKFLASDLQTALNFGEKASVDIDANIIDAIVNDTNNRGLRFGTSFLPGGIVDNSVGSNWRIFDREQSGINETTLTPYLQLTITAGQAGDFDGDLDVDGADFLKWQQDGLSAADLVLWQDNYGTGVGPLSTVGAVPEPSSIALLTLSSALLFSLRSLRRS